MLPLTIVVFGATGDLFKKKLGRAFFDMATSGEFPEKFTLVGLSRKQLSHAEFREITAKAIGDDVDFALREVFLQKVCYYSIDATDQFSLEALRDILDQVDRSHSACSNKLFYIATVPAIYEEIFRNISALGLGVPCIGSLQNTQAWIRIIVEKPFGTNLANAQKLDELLGESFDESQIFRMDHYLAKETVQNIYSFRFKNVLFAPLWSRKYIDRVEIFMFETDAKDANPQRKRSYDEVGALRDVGQNHLLELLSLITMEEPDEESTIEVRKKRSEALKDTHFEFKKKGDLVLGQYNGYAVDKFIESKTETYFKVRLSVDNERWKDIPFWLEHGAALNETRTGIAVYFKKAKNENQPNTIYFKIQPDAQICVELKTFGVVESEQKTMCFDLSADKNQFIYPYEKLLRDTLEGDQTLFVSTAEVGEEWRITREIQDAFEDAEFKLYERGSQMV